jgi:hypothetical protein
MGTLSDKLIETLLAPARANGKDDDSVAVVAAQSLTKGTERQKHCFSKQASKQETEKQWLPTVVIRNQKQ